ncbi:hypothetical protein [Staphylococcus haemolyticus]|uniref:hypothetical protein n=1 Tax=Staphylococcus haemolyticus TaxID=1283 RepID=UPI00068EFBCF|nr:hypothetical protein [Staphylococcus haemolyticus]MCH4326201.1 hypothetical protein [Staphylococcus haemolyticus]MCH4414274.1 hypothetical protein [Staphylococcus haemolyticus]MCH4419084.1 hypothetical protein [Staphylococcus haemolyticus]MCH4456594.1 hypothetical protein [Staphylococcus haemolyticus]
MITKQNIQVILNCSEVYAQKMIDWANGNQNKLINLINHKLLEQHDREAAVEYGINRRLREKVLSV